MLPWTSGNLPPRASTIITSSTHHRTSGADSLTRITPCHGPPAQSCKGEAFSSASIFVFSAFRVTTVSRPSIALFSSRDGDARAFHRERHHMYRELAAIGSPSRRRLQAPAPPWLIVDSVSELSQSSTVIGQPFQIIIILAILLLREKISQNQPLVPPSWKSGCPFPSLKRSLAPRLNSHTLSFPSLVCGAFLHNAIEY